MIGETLNDFIESYGCSDLMRLLEIQAPPSQEVFVRRLYKEIGDMIRDLEASRKEISNDGEDRISVEIVHNLRARGYTAYKDPDHGGHVDIYVTPTKKNEYKWYAEAKLWNGPKYLSGGLNQLMTRYASGRQPMLGFFIYFQKPDLVNKMADWRNHITINCLHGFVSHNEIDDFSIETIHNHQSGAAVVVRHFGINFCWDPD